jgi:arylsulfatase A-like enzyme
MTHLLDPRHPRVLATYRAIDAALGRFVAAAAARGEPPVLFVAADHGASTMPQHCDVALHLEAWGVPTLRHPVHVWRRNARAAVMVSGNAGVQVYFEPRSGRTAPLTEAELPRDTLAQLLALPAVRAAAWRDDRGGVVAWAAGRRARLSEVGGLVRYEPVDGDPLELGGAVTLEDRELLARSRGTSLPDAPRQLLQLFRTERAGDVALAAGLGSDFRGPWEIPEHKAGHGSLIPDHMEVPIAASIPLPDAPLRTVDLMPTMLDVLGVAPPSGIDGVAFARLGHAAGVRA